MKKISAFIFSVLFGCSLIFSLAGCLDKKEEKSSNSETSKRPSVNVVSQVSQYSPVGENLKNSFGNLWSKGTFYISYKMTVEYNNDLVSSHSDISNENNQDNEETELTRKVYEITIAVDSQKQLAGLKMQGGDSAVNLVISDKVCYNINHSEYTYTTEKYTDNVITFGKEYTENLSFGILENLKMSDTAKTDYNGAETVYEKYNVNYDNTEISDDMTVIYYFDKSGKPIAEITETPKGKTTFEITEFSDKISSDEIFEIPDDYSEIKNS